MNNGRVRILFTRLRTEEKLLAERAERLGVPYSLENIRDLSLPMDYNEEDIFICRCISHFQNLAIARMLESYGLRTINPSGIMSLCGDKIATSSVLTRHNIPQPRYRVAFSAEGALAAAREIGFPVVFKPSTGSWGRLIAKAQDEETAQSIIEHKEHLGALHHVFYIQEYVEKPGFDIRAFVLGGEPLCAISRRSAHWITNTARGASAENYPIDQDMDALLRRVYEAIPADFMAVDIFITEQGYLVNEVNDSAEFRNSIETTGCDIPAKVIQYAQDIKIKRTKCGIKKDKRAPYKGSGLDEHTES
ncbi:L-2-aminoadipate N-acetyltransferase [Thermovirga lienii DSM 17291]|uniref:L-2-aminoadipate N-acetyltransferase n=1 Tax=Thermovirga lienii (strain ATCC BAA-1197 / DSM 17291 / Cas60314) TaxID=580340 RepID=G7V705_THELD|nr:lysine biosynthesis protein LysX [Thermovirga lienii]AER67194.1 L-2-aminoadipate N-acetyltransferase [Thermovirga lienii DSM 17291]MDN5318315.1 [lysine-biosynthesis-protein LysW]---L-2-aminoadipate ligase [Thermovirga sp.]MDN5367705.1 [lysine-biosynthesis-protein LysW]---L-2-aminoadipate ligase [Thermovirga sp.]